MGDGRLAAVDLTANTITDVYTVPASNEASVNINICNTNDGPAKVRLALAATAGVQAAGEFIEHDEIIAGHKPLERTGIKLAAGQIVSVFSDVANVSVVVTGIEETA